MRRWFRVEQEDLETIVNIHDFYSLNLWRILSGGLVWSSHTVIVRLDPMHALLFNILEYLISQFFHI